MYDCITAVMTDLDLDTFLEIAKVKSSDQDLTALSLKRQFDYLAAQHLLTKNKIRNLFEKAGRNFRAAAESGILWNVYGGS